MNDGQIMPPPPSRGRDRGRGAAQAFPFATTPVRTVAIQEDRRGRRGPPPQPSPSRGEGRAGKRPGTSRARHLRRNATFAERKLWEALRQKKLGGLRFRLQQPIGPYVADFFCPSAKLVIELDGYFHDDILRIQRDQVRTAWLNAHGIRVLRFGNDAISKALEEVLDAICKSAGVVR